MRAVELVGGLLLVIAGAVWVLQGFDVAFAPESFMTNRRQWILWGLLAIAVGGWFLNRARTRR